MKDYIIAFFVICGIIYGAVIVAEQTNDFSRQQLTDTQAIIEAVKALCNE